MIDPGVQAFLMLNNSDITEDYTKNILKVSLDRVYLHIPSSFRAGCVSHIIKVPCKKYLMYFRHTRADTSRILCSSMCVFFRKSPYM